MSVFVWFYLYCISLFMLQGMEEMSLEQFKNGGVNITGFQLVNQTSGIVERFLNKWSKYDRPRSSNKDIIKVRSLLLK